MAGFGDFLRRIQRLEEQMRLMAARRKGHSQDRTFIVGGEITPALYVPPMFIGINVDDLTPQWKTLTGFSAILRTGSATLRWQHNGVDIDGATAHNVSAVANPIVLTELQRVRLAHGDTVGFVIDSGDGAGDLSAAAFVATGSS